MTRAYQLRTQSLVPACAAVREHLTAEDSLPNIIFGVSPGAGWRLPDSDVRYCTVRSLIRNTTNGGGAAGQSPTILRGAPGRPTPAQRRSSASHQALHPAAPEERRLAAGVQRSGSDHAPETFRPDRHAALARNGRKSCTYFDRVVPHIGHRHTRRFFSGRPKCRRGRQSRRPAPELALENRRCYDCLFAPSW